MCDPAVGPPSSGRQGNGADGVGAGGAATKKTPVRCSPKLDPFKAAIGAMLTTDIEAPRKQRHTARRILARLADELGAQRLSYSTVRDYVRGRRTQIDVDIVLFATGYSISIPYLPTEYIQRTGGRPKMFLNAFAPRPGLFGISYIEVNSSAYTLFDRISHLVAGSVTPKATEKVACPSLCDRRAREVRADGPPGGKRRFR